MACQRDHSGEIPKAVIDALPESQRGPWRHACAACAYLLGLQHGEEARERLVKRIRELEARLEAAGAGRNK